ncbi:error-prone DNA polymerase [Pseudoroseomonas cervicalis]|uniref:error-prone DNA polymerase n=1 Tax=Teichococcus cervicalis TaxID=204525 RepID=UPI0022F1CA41|nr:error-prone DNA polymerase [Pseudoroseomonas cervicalis]WBV42540.1 error-prone DNA polymerase [Pseudoroseomonas cervicalis]
MPPGYVELGARSNFSLLDGASHPAELVLTAKALGHAGIGICDTNSLAGVVRGHVAAREEEVPYVVGARLVLDDGTAWLAWPTDRASYGRLSTLLSRGKMRAPKGECQISFAEMVEHAEGWCLAAIPPRRPGADFASRFAVAAMDTDGHLALPLFCTAAFYLDGHDHERLPFLADAVARAGCGAELLAWNDVRYHNRQRQPVADLVTAIRLTVTVDSLGPNAEPNDERCLKSPAAMARLFARYPEALANTVRVLEATRGFSLSQLRHEYPDEILEPGRTPQQTLTSRVAEAAAERWPNGVPASIQERLDHELRLIQELDYAPYFLTVHEVVRFARRKGILCQGRGSAANSTCCYVLGITAVDPAKHDLLFERFVSASRNEPPDIDVDFEHERREEVIQHIYERYGRHRAAIAGTVIRYRARSAVREVGKAMGLSEDVTGRLAKASWGPGREQTLAELASGLGLDPADTRLNWTLQLAEEIQDFPRHLATHVGGFVISRGPLTELAVVGNAAMEGRTVLEWDKDDIDALGLLKVDILALGMLSMLRRGFSLLRRHHRRDLDLAGIPRDCPETYAMLRRADSLGVFQIESRAQMNMLPRLRPEKFYDLVIQVAIIRPGPIQGDMVHPYLRRRWGLEQPVYPSPSPDQGHPDELKDVLKRTLGVPLFQEQAMRVAMVAAEFTPEEADKLRRAMATFKHTQGVSEYRDRLVGGMVRRGYDPELAERVFRQLEGFGSYGFPESHAASFAHLAYASSWMKRWHPSVFAAALLNAQPMGFYAPAQIVRDAREHGVAVRPVDVNRSDWDCTLEPEPDSAEGLALRLGLRQAAGLAQAEAERVVKAREAGNRSPFSSVEEVVRRAELTRKGTEALAEANAFGGMGVDRRAAMWAARGVEKDIPPLLLLAAQSAAAGEPPLLPEPEPTLPPEQAGQKVVLDYLSTGMSLGHHPLELLRPRLRDMGCRDTREVDELPAGKRILLAGLVLMRQRPGTSKGVVFVTVEDEHGQANLVVFANIVDRDRAALINARLLVVKGKIERETEHAEVPVTHVIVEQLIDRTDLLQGLDAAEPADWGAASLGRADEVRRPEPGSRRPALNLRSRDFH